MQPFANAFFLWLCLTMPRKAFPHTPVHLLQAGCIAAALLTVAVPLAWLWYGRAGSLAHRAALKPPKVFLLSLGSSLQLSEAFVALGLILFFEGAPASASAFVPAAALGLDLFLLLPWVIRYKTQWHRQHG